MKRFILLAVMAACHLGTAARGQTDTIRVSHLFTTHVVFPTDVIYADLSSPQTLAAKVIEQSRNIVAVKARSPFDKPASLSALESNGMMHTFIVTYDETPPHLVIDCRPEARQDATEREKDHGGKVSSRRSLSAPLSSEVRDAPQALHHLSAERNGVRISCINVMTCSDITYLVFEVRNRSGVSYECGEASFVVEGRKKSRKAVVYERNLMPRSRSGSLSAAPGGISRICYTMDKLSLSDDQVLNAYFYEEGGPRELLLTLGAEDVNRARNSLKAGHAPAHMPGPESP